MLKITPIISNIINKPLQRSTNTLEKDRVICGPKMIVIASPYSVNYILEHNLKEQEMIIVRKVIQMQKSKNLPLTKNLEAIKINALLKKARGGDVEALNNNIVNQIILKERSKMTTTGDKIKFNVWDYPQVYRFITIDEIKNLLKGYIIAPQRDMDESVFVTNDINFNWMGPFRVKLKLKDIFNPLLERDNKIKSPYIQSYIPEVGNYKLYGGYSLDDVECIEIPSDSNEKWEKVEIKNLLNRIK